MSEPDPRTLRREHFDAVRPVPTRWSDNDMFGHLNNAVYLELFDSVLNAWMQEQTGIDENVAPTLGVVAETSCRYYREVSFPVTVDVGVRANRLGRTSVVFEFGVFLPDDEQIAAHGLWAQVYVDRETRRPVPLPDAVRTHLESTGGPGVSDERARRQRAPVPADVTGLPDPRSDHGLRQVVTVRGRLVDGPEPSSRGLRCDDGTRFTLVSGPLDDQLRTADKGGEIEVTGHLTEGLSTTGQLGRPLMVHRARPVP